MFVYMHTLDKHAIHTLYIYIYIYIFPLWTRGRRLSRQLSTSTACCSGFRPWRARSLMLPLRKQDLIATFVLSYNLFVGQLLYVLPG